MEKCHTGGGEHLREAPAQRDIDFADLDKFKYYTIGPACAFVCRFVLFPFALVKTRLQMQKEDGGKLFIAGGGSPKLPNPGATGLGTSKATECIRYSGTIDAFSKIVRHEGVRGLFKGFGVSCIGTALVRIQSASGYRVRHRVYPCHTQQ